MLDISLVHTAYFNFFIALNPPGESPELPLGADIRSRADDYHKPRFFGGFNKAFNIQPARKIVFTGLGLVKIPRTVGFDTVAAQGFQLCENILPGIGHIAKIMHRARYQLYRSSVLIKIAVFNFKIHNFTDFKAPLRCMPPRYQDAPRAPALPNPLWNTAMHKQMPFGAIRPRIRVLRPHPHNRGRLM